MRESFLQIAKRHTLVLFLLVLLTLAACSESATPIPNVTPRAGPSWAPQQAIEMIEAVPLSTGELAWNAEFDRYLARWKVTLVYEVRQIYPPRDERRTLLWFVYEDTGEVEGPFK